MGDIPCEKDFIKNKKWILYIIISLLLAFFCREGDVFKCDILTNVFSPKAHTNFIWRIIYACTCD